MSFGFPAYHVENIQYKSDFSTKKIIDSIKNTIQTRSFILENNTDRIVYAKTQISGLSWGEKIIIKINEDNSLNIKSKCSFPMQCFDWGKNKENVNGFIAVFNNLIDKVELKNALENVESVVEEKVKESNESGESPKDKLIKLNEFKEKGLISEEDFNSKKEEILKEM